MPRYNGFRDVEHYYEAMSALGTATPRVRSPLLVLYSEDDPCAGAGAAAQAQEKSRMW